MKNLNLIFIVACFFVVGCIPSLHPIYTEDTITLDDRLIGDWMDENSDREEVQMFEDSIFKNFTKMLVNMASAANNDLDTNKFNSIFDSFESSTKWKFERAVNAKCTGIGLLKLNPVDLENTTRSKVEKSWSGLATEIEYTDLDHYILTYYEFTESEKTLKMMNVYLTEIDGQTYADFYPHEDTESKNLRFAANVIPAHTFAKIDFVDDQILLQSFDTEYIEDLIESKRIRLKHEVVDGAIILTASTKELRAFVKKYGNDDRLYAEEEVLVAL